MSTFINIDELLKRDLNIMKSFYQIKGIKNSSKVNIIKLDAKCPNIILYIGIIFS